MKTSLKIFIKTIITAALFTAGAILGSQLPEYLKIYSIVVGVCLAILFFIFVGFNGHKKEEIVQVNEDDE